MMFDFGVDGLLEYNFDEVYVFSLKILLCEEGLDVFDDVDWCRIVWEVLYCLVVWLDVCEGLDVL